MDSKVTKDFPYNQNYYIRVEGTLVKKGKKSKPTNEDLLVFLKKLDKKVDDMGERIDNLEIHMNARFDKVEQRLDKVEKRLDKVEKRLDKVEQRLDKVEQRLDKVEKDINNIVTINNLKR